MASNVVARRNAQLVGNERQSGGSGYAVQTDVDAESKRRIFVPQGAVS
jgi:hypothetical protein